MGLRVGLSVGVLEGFEGSSEGVYVLHCIAWVERRGRGYEENGGVGEVCIGKGFRRECGLRRCGSGRRRGDRC